MTREELLRHCKYYKGEEDCPYEDLDKVAFWSGEEMFVNEISRNEELYRNYVALAKEA